MLTDLTNAELADRLARVLEQALFDSTTAESQFTIGDPDEMAQCNAERAEAEAVIVEAQRRLRADGGVVRMADARSPSPG